MNHIPLRILLVAGAMAWAGLAQAAAPTAVGHYVRASVISGMHNSVPPNCVEATTSAITTWNTVGANFSIFPDFLVSTPRPDEQTVEYNEANITIDTGLFSEPRAVMGTARDVNPTTKIITNSDIRVDDRRVWNHDPSVEQLSCSTLPPTINQVDWQTVMLHELGHAIGFLHDASIGCAMYGGGSPGTMQRTLCADEKQAYIDNYKALRITSIPNVSGPQQVNIPAKIFYAGTPVFPVKRRTQTIQCASGWSCSDYNGSYATSAPSPLTFNFKCTPGDPLPTATFKWRTTLTDANGVVTNAVDHTSTCTRPAGSLKERPSGEPKRINRVIITD
ncbi:MULTISPECIES: matrixin family metalloprotease [unclassified Lysobacter]|uniref:matrixin family metalloprotease n=1 Tax=unclassified Lysobacter TaxID=2635362 RepID=UPI001BEB1F38|nr:MULTISPECIES: matrixin family metalloprotease [unclassified Lysobacter]MBT2745619.1 hypothetical protein [Lysobacter sp. ISL-42]MBT2753558.1 hypothetical protein [Lysobacter sp. ISL-50]MBT2777058.1 hypothetical protein [Lysobacter sp. ISL-54]MBT2780316.1 hypothetical protein [Lysobacter sp. ISL-52]